MESDLSWVTLFALAILCAGLIVYAFWHWTKRGSQAARRSLLIGAALLVAATPALLRVWLTATDDADLLAQKDEAMLEAFIAKQGAWTGDPGSPRHQSNARHLPPPRLIIVRRLSGGLG